MEYLSAKEAAEKWGLSKRRVQVLCTQNRIEGLIRVASLQGDYFEYNESAYEMVGVHTGKTYKLGQTVRVQVTGADKMTRTIDFELVSDREE